MGIGSRHGWIIYFDLGQYKEKQRIAFLLGGSLDRFQLRLLDEEVEITGGEKTSFFFF